MNYNAFTQVEKTAVDSYLAKQSCAFQSNLSQIPTHSKQVKRSPILNLIYYERSKLIRTILSFFKFGSTANSSTICTKKSSDQFLCLGAGLDLSYDDFMFDSFYVDTDNIIAERIKMMENHANLQPIKNTRVHLISCDLTNSDMLIKLLSQNGFDFSKRTIILLECVLAYLDAFHIEKLFKILASTISNAFMIMYDPLLKPVHERAANNGIKSMCHETVYQDFSDDFKSNFIRYGGKYFSTLVDHSLLLRRSGWAHVSVYNMNDAFTCFLSPHQRMNPYDNSPKTPNTASVAIPFDEFGSLSLLRKQYIFSMASNSEELYQGFRIITEMRASGGESGSDRNDPPSNHSTQLTSAQRLLLLSARLTAANLRVETLLKIRKHNQ
jgi:O-methyltransferase involved in polyketide biosynthesis